MAKKNLAVRKVTWGFIDSRSFIAEWRNLGDFWILSMLVFAFYGLVLGLLSWIPIALIDPNWATITWPMWTLVAGPVLGVIGGWHLPKLHVHYGMDSSYQRDAVDAYLNCSESTQKLFPKGFYKTVRDNPEDAHELYQAAMLLQDADKERLALQKKTDDRVPVALQLMRERAGELAKDNANERKVLGK